MSVCVYIYIYTYRHARSCTHTHTHVALRQHFFFKKTFIAPIILLLSRNISAPLTENKGLRQSYSFLGHLEEMLKKLAFSVSNIKISNLETICLQGQVWSPFETLLWWLGALVRKSVFSWRWSLLPAVNGAQSFQLLRLLAVRVIQGPQPPVGWPSFVTFHAFGSWPINMMF